MSTKISDHNPLRCIWMDAGVVGYKLCDRNLQCDHCPFDESMRRPSRTDSARVSSSPRSEGGGTRTGSISDRVSELVSAIAPGAYPGDRLYHSGHLWVKPVMESLVAIGIDHLATSVLGSLASIVLPSRQTRIIHRMPWCWLIHREGAISLPSPLHGVIVETNSRLLEHPELLVQDPYGDGWLVHAQVDVSAAEGPTLFASPEYRLRGERELVALRARVLQSLRKDPSVGQTLYDGGQPAETLASMLGGKLFFKIITPLFTP